MNPILKELLEWAASSAQSQKTSHGQKLSTDACIIAINEGWETKSVPNSTDRSQLTFPTNIEEQTEIVTKSPEV